MRNLKRRIIGLVAAIATIVPLTVVGATQHAQAAVASDFDPGYIISDERFYDHNSMSQQEIQTFLNKQVPTCRSNDPTLPCLKDLVTSTNSRAADAPGHCAAYNSEGWESAARILWRVSQACRINPQVLIVMLQKEQSLVTATKPNAWQYRAAMGADCPDTAPCAPNTIGFFNQVYKAAWQLRQYTYNPTRWRHQVGPVSIGWHPNAACGSSTVTIRNQATANLYNYTPYQPNAAALNNLYGSGDGCSSYGNRNFWRTFTDWFGSPTINGVAAINGLYASLGGASGALGAATSVAHSIKENGGGSAQAFANGSIYWTVRTGAAAVLEPERSLYFTYGGAVGRLGWPNSQRVKVTANGENGAGQSFTGGSVYTSSVGSHAVFGAMRATYFARSGAAGWLAFPRGAAQSISGGTTQDFQNGTIFMETSGMGGAVSSSLVATYRELGATTSSLGWPRSDTVTIPNNGGGVGQVFQHGSLYSSAAGGFAVSGAIRDYYFTRAGAAGPLGWPTSAMSCNSSVTECRQNFQGGTVVTSAGSSPRVTSEAIDNYYANLPSATDHLGARIGDAVRIPQNGGGFGQTYAKGSVYSSAAGTFRVQGPTRNLYWARNGSAGALGWPTGEWRTRASSGEGFQPFQHGTIFVDPVSGAYVGHPAIEDVWWAAGGPQGALGRRASELIHIPQNGGGHGQVYQNGSVYSSAAGAFAVTGGVRAVYFAHGGAAGALRWPTGAQSCDAAGLCTQRFQGGTITFSPATGGAITTQ